MNLNTINYHVLGFWFFFSRNQKSVENRKSTGYETIYRIMKSQSVIYLNRNCLQSSFIKLNVNIWNMV